MKHMKKVLALVLALVMVLALGVTASATEPVSEPTMKYRVDYTEYAEGGKGIKDGVFTMMDKNSANVFEAISNENGVAVFENLPVGTYTLTQKTAPSGYQKAFCTNYKQNHAAEITVTVEKGKVTAADGSELHDGVYAVFDKDDNGSKCYQWEGAPENLGYYVPALFQSEKAPIATVTIPFTKVVKLGGNAAPGSQKFELKITPAGDPVNVKTTAEVNTTGAGSYNGTITIEGAKSQVVNLVARGFAVEEVNDGAANWTYSDAKYNVVKTGQDRWDGTGTPTFAFYPVVNGQQTNVAVDEMTFTNTYTQNVTYTRPAQPTETKIGSPKTFDAGIGLYAVSTLLSVTGGAWLVGKKHK